MRDILIYFVFQNCRSKPHSPMQNFDPSIKKPEFVIKPRRQFVDEGSMAKFKMSHNESPQTKIAWDKDGLPLRNQGRTKVCVMI